MKSIFVDIPECTLKFFLFEDEVDSAMAKKLSSLGLPKLDLSFLEHDSSAPEQLSNGHYLASDHDLFELPLSEVTAHSRFQVNYNDGDKTIDIVLAGKFFSVNELDDEAALKLVGIRDAYVWVTLLRNSNGKIIKKPKDSYGSSDPIEAISEKNNYDCGWIKVPNVSISVTDADF